MPITTPLTHTIKTWKGDKQVATNTPESVMLLPGEEKEITQTIKTQDAHLWALEDPFLYVLESKTAGDSLITRFGMREFHFDATTKRATLNGKVYYLRGSNITLHRFFEDPQCGELPWNDAWVRKLLGDIPKRMHWNYFRFCIGPVPDRWFEICDEVGLLAQNEFPVWTGGPSWYDNYKRDYDTDVMIPQYKDWMRDGWNHPSVAVWDANNETTNPILINEYGWLWLNRDGSPTLLTENVYSQLMGKDVTPRQRLDMYAYLLGAKTEYWRAHRQYAGILHFVYLTCSYPGVYTADHFVDIPNLKLDPAFEDYMGEAFKPLVLYINFFQPTLKAGTAREFKVMMVNDRGEPMDGELALTLETRSGKVLAKSVQDFSIPGLGSQSKMISLTIPKTVGECLLKAVAKPKHQQAQNPTVCRRWLSVVD